MTAKAPYSARIQSRFDGLLVVVVVPSLVATLALQLWTAPAISRRCLVLLTGVLWLSALLGGLLAARRMGASIAARVGSIQAAATAVLAGHLDRPPIKDSASDEIGRLAREFDRMLLFLREIGTVLTADAVEEQARLDGLVKLRTAALKEAHARLETEMYERERIETKLRLAQKLEAIGRLASGIAHEINTPIQFVQDTFFFARDAMNDLVALILMYRGVLRSVRDGATTLAGAAAEATEAEERADLVYLLEQMPVAFARIFDGLERIATLVRSMKEFAHPDRKEMSPANLNRAIDNTLTMARNEYRYVAELITDFAEIPDVICHIGEINQAVLNLLINAAHAVADVVKNTGAKGQIHVSTRREGDRVLIRVTDTGPGIPPDICDRIFEPFFTTKEVGKGTGQGLAIARSVVVDSHGGTLTVASELGHGTSFDILLPIAGPGANAAVA